ncbi:hypothetical protein [Costertonia aggregata]|uniref:Bulb-type lectin domain-containing protein n=1 Tax=Costertonia aggregata TaxID=343403 RepID=A0A7H9APF9_9FLAO|nr:hypothetical protein [Costertonia aggregata]QLG45351.1 hypothetical protein HYG79_08325 [Costertonia aggregata]
MKKLFFILVLCFLSCSKDKTSEEIPNNKNGFLGELDWVKNFGGSGADTGQAIISTLDGGFAVLGFSNSVDGDLMGKTTSVNDYLLLKLDAGGNLQWSKTYGGSKDDRGQSLIQTNDGGYALTGYAMSSDGDGSNNNGFHDNWILKLDASGNIEWEQSFGFSGHDHSYDIIQTADGGYFFVGFLDITSAKLDGYDEKEGTLTRHGVGEFWATKLNPGGEIQWQEYFGGSNNDRAHAVVSSNDGGFVMAGFSESTDFDISDTRGSYDFWVLKIDMNGKLVWEKSYGGTGIEISYDIAKTNDGAYVVTGNTFSVDADISKNNGESDIWLIKIDENGNLLWEKTYGGSGFDAAENVSVTTDGGFILSGNSKSIDGDASKNAGENDFWLIKTDADGNMVWQKSFGGTGLDFAYDALETQDGSIVLVGETSSADFPDIQNKGMSDVVLIKIK